MEKIEIRPGRVLRALLLAGLCVASVTVAAGVPRQPDRPPYLDPDLDVDTRARDLVGRMTTDEKIAQLMNDAPAIRRLQVPAYNWWNECLHGVARAGTATVFPQAIGLAASFDAPLMREVATAISDEARAKHHEFVRRGERGIYRGLTFWSPNINIFRDPRWGRGQETYGEDPYLTARMGVEFVKGLQGDDPRYLKVVATAKHFAVHSGPETDRHHFDAKPTERDFRETYLPAFRALVQEARVASIMGAYNRVHGESASASRRLLIDILRREWGFDGYVVSDCGAIEDIHLRHKIVPSPERAAALGVRNGCDLECGSVYKSLKKALRDRLVTIQDIDVAVTRLMLARLRLGMFDPPERVRYAQIPHSVNESPAHDRLARRMAQASLVLLKNDGLLPLSRGLKTIAVVGPTADSVMTLLGNYYGTPSRPVTVLAGIRNAVGDRAEVLHAPGADLVTGFIDPHAVPVIPSTSLLPPRKRRDAATGEQGLLGEYYRGRNLRGRPVLTRIDPTIGFRWNRRSPTSDAVERGELPSARALGDDEFSVRWTGRLVPPVSGRYEFVVAADDGARLTIDGRRLIDEWKVGAARPSVASLDLAAGREYDISLEYFEAAGDAEVRLAWRLPGTPPLADEALSAARRSDVIIFVGGLTGDVEGEEMSVPYPGFAGGDRTEIALPASQQQLLETLHGTGKPIVVVLTGGSAIGLEWAERNANAIVMAWYPGQQGGNALADVLFGDVSPSGRLPVTFYKSTAQLPPFDNYAMKGRTYRFFSGEPLYPFGHGLSYARFEYADLQLQPADVREHAPLEASVTVTNTGTTPAHEVVQLYARAVAPDVPMPVKQLCGFERIWLEPGASRRVSFRIALSDAISWYDTTRQAFVITPGAYEVQAGASSRDIRASARFRVNAEQVFRGPSVARP
jgi:beta-glucosidase